ncbi:hypothetical protein F5148DRAFT_1337901 [Russula earlei]|uniref:Uncharacterized protein n=1 Tax=Russula earlei TaxID=71964 RepID=A0ACC0UF39_9AGAM|nr:hypothetical protein F5148DRAFT_1337901 [Russula earlei]
MVRMPISTWPCSIPVQRGTPPSKEAHARCGRVTQRDNIDGFGRLQSRDAFGQRSSTATDAYSILLYRNAGGTAQATAKVTNSGRCHEIRAKRNEPECQVRDRQPQQTKIGEAGFAHNLCAREEILSWAATCTPLAELQGRDASAICVQKLPIDHSFIIGAVPSSGLHTRAQMAIRLELASHSTTNSIQREQDKIGPERVAEISTDLVWRITGAHA